jgi:nicotinate-nucleotide--dimethylbenzimidazole phosphoribosyltransferase
MDEIMKLKEIIQGIKPVDPKWIQKAEERTAQLVMPTRALGRLHEISERLCGIQQTLEPVIDQKAASNRRLSPLSIKKPYW